MWTLKPTNKKPIEVKYIKFDYLKNIRVSKIGEYIWFSIWKHSV